MEILTYPNAQLKQPCEVVEQFDDALRQFVTELETFMRTQPGGIGIAAAGGTQSTALHCGFDRYDPRQKEEASAQSGTHDPD